MVSESRSSSNKNNPNTNRSEQRLRSVFDVPSNFFDSCCVLHDREETSVAESSSVASSELLGFSTDDGKEDLNIDQKDEQNTKKAAPRWSCNTCKAEFESLQDQRSHFKSDFHGVNVKLSIAGKDTIKEDDFDELTSDSLFRDYDISSISGSEDEAESCTSNEKPGKAGESVKQKLFIRLRTGEMVSIWRSLLLDESQKLSFDDNDKLVSMENSGCLSSVGETELLERLKTLIHEPRDKTCLRIVLLASGGHFAGCVFDGNSAIAHKTYHRYVVRAKAGKKQSSKDASGRAAHSAGASLRRHNEHALKKEIQELFASWKSYFDASSCIFIHAPSSNRQLLFSGDKPNFSHQHSVIRHVPLTVRRPTFKEAKRVYNHLTNVFYETEENKCPPSLKEDSQLHAIGAEITSLETSKEQFGDHLETTEIADSKSGADSSDDLSISNQTETLGISTPLHEAAMSGNTQQILELLEQGFDPCLKDERGRTPYMLATEKEVRNTFRRFMALNLDKWDWHAAKVPSPLTKELEESQAAKQAEKDAKKKAKSKELKKLRKAKEKKAQAQATLPQNTPAVSGQGAASSVSVLKVKPHSSAIPHLSKEEELKRAQAEEREKRAAAAERRIAAAAAAALNGQGSNTQSGTANDVYCSCCNVSLAGKVPFHRYHYKYCTTSCMHVHREMLEDG